MSTIIHGLFHLVATLAVLGMILGRLIPFGYIIVQFM